MLSCNWSLNSSSIFELKYTSVKSSSKFELKYEAELWLKHEKSYYFEPLLFSSPTYIRKSWPLSSTQFDMQVKGEVVEAHISYKEATYQRSISVLCINNRGYISEAYINNI